MRGKQFARRHICLRVRPNSIYRKRNNQTDGQKDKSFTIPDRGNKTAASLCPTKFVFN